MTGDKFVIHIKGSTRHDRMIAEMDGQYKGEYSVVDGIVYKDSSKGISESFKSIIRENYEKPWIHIFEDDVMFTHDDSRKIFEHAFERLPENWDIFLGGSYTFIQQRNMGDYLKIENFRSLHCAVINKSVYDIFLSHDFIKEKNIDTWVASKNPNVYVCNPMIAIQYDGWSYNTKKNTSYNSQYLNDKNIAYNPTVQK